jgi:hypothetical protein
MRVVEQGTPSAGGRPAGVASAGEARSIAALLLAAKIAERLGVRLDDGELQGSVDVLIEQVQGLPAPRDYDEVARQAMNAVAEYGRRTHGVVDADGE